MEKANYAARFPRLSIKLLPSGEITEVKLKQLVMSGLIRADEYRWDFRWDYKAEVSFDMTPIPPNPPKPFLSTSLSLPGQVPDPDRRHTLTFFPVGNTKGLLRRPDVMIVKSRALRWPGRAGPDHEGVMHPDNLERLVEVKFPNDELSQEQERAYLRIAGGSDRFSVLEISDCRDRDDRERDKEYNKEHKPTGYFNPLQWPSLVPPRPAPVPVPVYGPEPTPAPALVENWTQQVQSAVDSLLEEGANGIRQLSQEFQQHLQDAQTWLSTKGEWVRRESQKAWEWVSETGGKILRWTDDQLRAIWQEVQRYTDLTLEALREVNWVQLLMNIGKIVATAVVIIVIGELIVAAAIPAALLTGLLAIIEIAAQSWVVLAAILAKLATSPVPRQALNF
ncbi:VRR-NUC domain-containing protein [Pseudomonas sp. NPDC096950]|uniref:VRR-NUC domain-containing protein n=1 Tax=Pseudomonas sp. NPDC096950 TaxID=3364485 RepID=UPI00383B8371